MNESKSEKNFEFKFQNQRTTMTTIMKLKHSVLLLSLLSCLAFAFQSSYTSPIRHASSFHPQFQVEKSSSALFRTSLSLQNQRNPNDPKEGYSKVEDGSPLGVAIVVLGGSLVVFGGDNFSNIPIWVVFVAASTAAGVARLIRYLQDKQ